MKLKNKICKLKALKKIKRQLKYCLQIYINSLVNKNRIRNLKVQTLTLNQMTVLK